MIVAFYKAEYGDWKDKLIAWWTGYKYSHTELILDSTWYSSSPRSNKVRVKHIDMDYKWDYVKIDVDKDDIVKAKLFLYDELGKKYDWKGIVLTQVFPLQKHSNNRWFCSELCAQVLINVGVLDSKHKAHWYSPGLLHDALDSKLNML